VCVLVWVPPPSEQDWGGHLHPSRTHRHSRRYPTTHHPNRKLLGFREIYPPSPLSRGAFIQIIFYFFFQINCYFRNLMRDHWGTLMCWPWEHIGISEFLGASGSVWEPLGPSANFLELLGNSGILGPSGAYGSFWDLLRAAGNLWEF